MKVFRWFINKKATNRDAKLHCQDHEGLVHLAIQLRIPYEPLRICASLDKTGRITRLSIFMSDVEVLPSLAAFRALQGLQIDQCDYLNNISSIGQSPWIARLTIDGCPRLREIPKQIGTLIELQVFSLRRMDGLEELPPEIGSLANLERFSLAECNVSVIPREIGNLQKLKYLTFAALHEVKECPEEIGNLGALEELELINMSNLLRLPRSIFCNLLNLKVFKASFMDSLLEMPSAGLWNLPKLKHVTIGCCHSLVVATPDIDDFSTSIQSLKTCFRMDGPWRNRVECYCGLNNAGRRLLHESNVPETLWCHVFARNVCTMDATFFLLRQNPGLVMNAKKLEDRVTNAKEVEDPVMNAKKLENRGYPSIVRFRWRKKTPSMTSNKH